MKIAMMYDFFSEHGGVERIMLFQAKKLREAGHEVSFAFAYADDKFKEERLGGFKTIEYSALPVKNETLQICSSIIRNDMVEKFRDFDLIICHSFPASYLAYRIKKKFKIPYVLHLHHPPQFLYTADLNWAKNSFKRKFSYFIGKIFRIPLRKFDKFCVKNADYYFVESKAVQRMVYDTYEIRGNILYPTIDEKFFSNKAVKLPKEVKGEYILGSGRIIRQKRFDYLIDAVSKLKNNIRVVLAGKYDEEVKRELESLAKEKNVRVVFLGPRSIGELITLYSKAKVCVLTCPKEWFGLVPVEAMACGCPVVAWEDNFGPQESITAGVSGFLAKPYDTNDLADKISKALSRKWSRKKIKKSVEKFSEENQKKVFLEGLGEYLR